MTTANTETAATTETATTETATAKRRGRPMAEGTLILREHVLSCLADAGGPVTSREIAEQLGEKPVNVNNALNHFYNNEEGVVHRVGTLRTEGQRGRPSVLWSATPLAEGQEPFAVTLPNPNVDEDAEGTSEAGESEESAE